MVGRVQSWPLFFGIDHYEGGGKGMKEKLASGARPGTRCFIEGMPQEIEFYNEGGKILASPTANFQTYMDLMGWLHERGVELVALDKESIVHVYKRVPSDNPLRTYVMTVVREHGWRHVIEAHARQGDFVVMHPAHLARIKRTWRIPRSRCVFVDKISRDWKPWLGWAADRRLKTRRQKEREQKAQRRCIARPHKK